MVLGYPLDIWHDAVDARFHCPLFLPQTPALRRQWLHWLPLFLPRCSMMDLGYEEPWEILRPIGGRLLLHVDLVAACKN